MKNKKLLKKLGLTLTCMMGTSVIAFAYPVVRDSIGVENQDGKKIILHKLEPKETYYSLSRKYNLNAKDLIAFNANKALKVGDVIKVPTNLDFAGAPSHEADIPSDNDRPPVGGGATMTSQASDYIEYKVGSKETLFAISKRFGVTVDAIKEANNLTDNSLKADQVIKIPNTPVEAAAADPNANRRVITNEELSTASGGTLTSSETAEEGNDTEESKAETPANRYGIKQVTANGVGIWMDDLNGETGKMLALHNAAPIGTVIKITNPMTNRTTYAKVVGKFNETSENRDAIIVISKSVASLIGVIDRRFQVNISY
ncbi:LysM peptidoglycan-binding domain-containing protein [Olivibacter sp. SDN3]|uniref:LysM peptidoglycan-binding domain-containing protein n=1 Tax=Olivibacter sp. SDN3 TaxID=2764720 RepID=UPI001650F949|nr:LysM peptidoglycan-binding domain-containing protein [Olivibacter sp. SDN3]QNL49880.1 LysM peptidoglycan-binding domain-containing protein [Olivibacter sp. SDN3]